MSNSSQAPTSNPTRELAAIMFSDIAGYTAIMGRDEQEAMRALDAHRGTLRSILPKYNGRLIGEIGDGTLTTFHSAIDAVNCAREVQALAETAPELRLRIGIHLGDVVFTGNTVIGDGVNVASRIHALASPGGICLSENVFNEIRNKPGVHASYLGRRRLKNVARAVRVYTLQAEPGVNPPIRSPIGRPTIVFAATLAIAVSIAIAYSFRSRLETAIREQTPSAKPTKATIAVLPFANLSASKDDEYFSDGMTEEIIGALSKIAGLQVTSSTSSFAFKGQRLDVKKIAQTLGVRNLLEGNVRRSANKLRIEVELIDAASGFALWSERYDRDQADVFAVQSDVAESVADKLSVSLLTNEKVRVERKPTSNLEAYGLYLQGNYYERGLEPNPGLQTDPLDKAMGFYQKAIDLDPSFARAYAELGNAYVWSWLPGLRPPREAFAKAESLYRQSLALDDTIGTSHTGLAWISFVRDWDWDGAERQWHSAFEIEPDNFDGYFGYGFFLMCMGRYEEALSELKRAHQLNPLDVVSLHYSTIVYLSLHQYDRALESANQAIEIRPDSPVGYAARGFIPFVKGDYATALVDFQKAASLSTVSADQANLAMLYGLNGRKAEARRILDSLTERSRHEYVSPLNFFLIHWGLGNRDQAFEWLEKSCEQRDLWVLAMKTAVWDPERSDPRFQAIYKKIGLPE